MNEYYTPAGNPGTSTSLSSSAVRSEFSLLQAAFDKFPAMSTNPSAILAVNAGGSAVVPLTALNAFPIGSVTPSTGAFTTLSASGAATFATTLAVTGASTLTGPVSAPGGITGGTINVTTLQQSGSGVWTAANLTNLNQLANGPSYITSAALSTYALLNAPTFTGIPAAPTAAVDTNTTQIATTGYVIGQAYLKAAAAAATYAPLGGAGASGTWPISVTGSASLNVLKAGDTMTGSLNIGTLVTTGSYGLAVSGPTLWDSRNGINGIIGSGNATDLFTTDTSKVIGAYNFVFKLFSDATAGPTAVISGYGGARIYTSNVERVRVDNAGNVSSTGPITAPTFTGALTTAAQPAITSVGTSLATTGTGAVNITADGRLYGTALHNNANPVTGTVNQYVASGTYTPTFTTAANSSAASMYSNYFTWMRVGNVVHVAGAMSITASAAGQTNVKWTLPIASTFTGASDVNGTAGSNVTAPNTTPGIIFGDVTSHNAEISINAPFAGVLYANVIFQYAVI